LNGIAFPTRKTHGARRADQELVTVLAQMTSSDEPITAWAVVRRMNALSQASSITRDAWRMGRLTAAEQQRAVRIAESPILESKFLGDIVPDIRFLRAFAQVARVGNFGYAARELQINPPTLSRQMQALEKTFATKLLVRHGRGVILTQAGLRLARRLETALPLLLAPLHDNRRKRPVMMDTLSFGVIPGIDRIMSRIVPQFRTHWPNVKLSIHEESSSILEERLIDQTLNIAVLQDPPSLDVLLIEPISTEPTGLIASVSTPIGNDHSPIRLHDLVRLPLILSQVKDNIRRRLEKACFQHGLRLSPLLETDSPQLMLAMVRDGHAFAVLPHLMVQEEIGRGSLVFRDIVHKVGGPVQPVMNTIHAVATNREAPCAPEFIAFVRDVVRAR
jgi:LysR family nitrogen assimilation transcriptional regulator